MVLRGDRGVRGDRGDRGGWEGWGGGGGGGGGWGRRRRWRTEGYRGRAGPVPRAGDARIGEVVVISLRKDAGRRAAMRARCSWPLRFQEAVDGSRLQGGWGAEAAGRTLTRGESGCFASHVEAWRRAAAAPHATLVVEDDAAIELPAQFGELERRTAGLREFDVLVLGLNHFRPDLATRGGPPGAPGAPYYWTDGQDLYGLHAYVVTPRGARELVRAFETHGARDPRPGGLSSGVAPVDFWVGWVPGVRVVALHPALVEPVRGSESNTQGVR